MRSEELAQAIASGERLRRGLRRLDAALSNAPRKTLFISVRGRSARFLFPVHVLTLDIILTLCILLV